MLFGLPGDVLFALRMMRKAPWFTAVAVVTLALGIGANTTIFSVVNATLLKPLPFPDPDRVVLVWESDAKGTDLNIVSAPRFWDWQRETRVFEHMALFDSAGKGYSLGANGDGHQGEQVSGVRVTAGFFTVLGVQPLIGRAFLPEEEEPGRDRVVVLSHALWMRHYDGDRRVVGREIRIDGEQYVVIGVMPPEFRFQFWSDSSQLWVSAGWTRGDRERNSHSFVAMARLRPGVSVAQANAELAAVTRRLAQQHEQDRDTSARVIPLGAYGLEGVQGISAILLAAVGFVLLIGCVNVANLMLARGAERGRDFAVRRALGASPGRVLRQLLVESLLLSAAGGTGGLVMAYWASRALTPILPGDFSALPMRPLDTVTLDLRVLAFTLLVSSAAGLLFGLAPGLGASSGDLRQPLSEGGREWRSGRRTRTRHLLVAAEVGLTLVVLTCAGLMIKSMARLLAVDPGFDANNVVTMQLSLPQENIYYGPPGHPRFCDEVSERVGRIPGVLAVGAAAPAGLAPEIRRQVALFEPDRSLSEPRTMEDVVRGSTGSRRFPMVALTAFAGLALVLAGVGVLGVVCHAVTQRTHEVGVRVALGAQRRNVVWLLVRSTMWWVLGGVIGGTAGSLGAARLVAGMLYEVRLAGPWVLASVAVLLVGVALAASYVPASRATRVDPLAALRSE